VLVLQLHLVDLHQSKNINGTIVSGLEMALWDIKGKAFNVPVYELLGGAARDKIKVYSWIGGDRPSEVAEQAHQNVRE
jgi:galactonate dehydratase